MKATDLTRVTSRPIRVNGNKQSITVAIRFEPLNLLCVPGGFSLVPESSATAAPEVGLPLFQGQLEALAIHIGQAQHTTCRHVLNNRRNQPAVIEPQFSKDGF